MGFGSSRMRAAIAAIGLLVFFFNTRLLGGFSLWCDRRVDLAAAEKEQSYKEALAQLQEALDDQEDTLSELREERASSRKLRKLLQDARARETGGAGGGGELKRRRRRRGAQLAEAEAAAEEQVQQAGQLPLDDHRGVGARADAAARADAPIQQTPQAADPASVAQSSSSQTAAAADPAAANASSQRLDPASIAVVVIAYNRPQYLDRALRAIYKSHPGGDAYPVYVSQDGTNAPVTDVVRRHGAHSLVHPRHTIALQRGTYLAKMPGYAYLSVHYGWALRTLFGMGRPGAPASKGAPYSGVIILEEDIEVAVDFFSYFTATAKLLDQDPTLLCVSAFNDNGQTQYAGDPQALHRSDFFPGLGWLLTRKLWAELDAKWPEERGFWDDWLREPPQRQGRVSIRPEVSRTFTFGERGTSVGQFYTKYLGKIALNQQGVSWQDADLRYLLKPEYDQRLDQWLARATVVPSLSAALHHDGGTGDLKLLYTDPKEFVGFCKRLGLMEDLKAGVPRTAYRGVVVVPIKGRRLFLTPQYEVVSPPGDVTLAGRRPLGRAILTQQGVTYSREYTK